MLKHILEHGVAWAPDQEIVYRDKVRHTYTTTYRRVLRLTGALQTLGVEPGTKVGVIEWDSHRYLEMYFGVTGVGAIPHTINPVCRWRSCPHDGARGGRWLIFHEDFSPLVEQVRPRLPSIRKYIVIIDRADDEHPEERPDIEGADAEYEELLAGASPLDDLPDLDENTQPALPARPQPDGIPATPTAWQSAPVPPSTTATSRPKTGTLLQQVPLARLERATLNLGGS